MRRESRIKHPRRGHAAKLLLRTRSPKLSGRAGVSPLTAMEGPSRGSYKVDCRPAITVNNQSQGVELLECFLAISSEAMGCSASPEEQSAPCRLSLSCLAVGHDFSNWVVRFALRENRILPTERNYPFRIS